MLKVIFEHNTDVKLYQHFSQSQTCCRSDKTGEEIEKLKNNIITDFCIALYHNTYEKSFNEMNCIRYCFPGFKVKYGRKINDKDTIVIYTMFQELFLMREFNYVNDNGEPLTDIFLDSFFNYELQTKK